MRFMTNNGYKCSQFGVVKKILGGLRKACEEAVGVFPLIFVEVCNCLRV